MIGFLKDKFNAIKSKLAKMHRSATIWFNGLCGTVILAFPYLQDQLPQLLPYLNGNTARYIGGAIVLANIMLRFKTDKALEHK